jgi:hypothetical protein
MAEVGWLGMGPRAAARCAAAPVRGPPRRRAPARRARQAGGATNRRRAVRRGGVVRGWVRGWVGLGVGVHGLMLAAGPDSWAGQRPGVLGGGVRAIRARGGGRGGGRQGDTGGESLVTHGQKGGRDLRGGGCVGGPVAARARHGRRRAPAEVSISWPAVHSRAVALLRPRADRLLPGKKNIQKGTRGAGPNCVWATAPHHAARARAPAEGPLIADAAHHRGTCLERPHRRSENARA